MDIDKGNDAGYIADDKIRFEPHVMAIRLLETAVWLVLTILVLTIMVTIVIILATTFSLIAP